MFFGSIFHTGTRGRTRGECRAHSADSGQHAAQCCHFAGFAGSKMRVGKLAEDPVELEEGSRLTVTTREVPGDAECVSTTYAGLPRDVKPADRILLDDGHIELLVREVYRSDVVCEVVVGGAIKIQ